MQRGDQVKKTQYNLKLNVALKNVLITFEINDAVFEMFYYFYHHDTSLIIVLRWADGQPKTLSKELLHFVVTFGSDYLLSSRVIGRVINPSGSLNFSTSPVFNHPVG